MQLFGKSRLYINKVDERVNSWMIKFDSDLMITQFRGPMLTNLQMAEVWKVYMCSRKTDDGCQIGNTFVKFTA